MRGTPSAGTTSTRHRHVAATRRSRSAGVLGALSVVVMTAALGTLVLTDGDTTSAASPVEVVAAGQVSGRSALHGAGQTSRDKASRAHRSTADRPHRSTAAATPSTSAPVATTPAPSAGTPAPP
ncbi:MAG: hypothetical protein JWR62_2998, partial [Modestobacter sp.]|nr:hypothetical protein [Modestobacter sp.]